MRTFFDPSSDFRAARSRLIFDAVVAFLVFAMSAPLPAQAPAVPAVDENVLRQYVGSYQWGPHELLHVQRWAELTGVNQLVAFTGSGEIRALFPIEHDQVFAGPGA